MKRKKAKPPVKLDISENLAPTTKGFRSTKASRLAEEDASSVDEILMNGVLEQRSGVDRIPVLRAVYKVLKPGGKAVCQVAMWSAAAACMSPFSQWPPLCPESFGFFSAKVRKDNGYSNPALDDIDFEVTWSELYDAVWQTKSDPVREFAARYYNNVVLGLVVTLTKKG